LARRKYTYVAFILSGVAGLIYEALWGRYLGLYVGHSAYAQVLVLAVYLGGMAVGAMAVSERSKALSSPLRWYAGVEGALALFGLLFHPIFLGMVDLSYETLFPALGTAGSVGALRWGLAGLVILPQAILLGTTFPLMAAGLVRRDTERPGRGIATVYFLNTLGGAFGVLVAGFWLIGKFGLPGTSITAALLNLCAAALVMFALAGADSEQGSAPAVPSVVANRDSEPDAPPEWAGTGLMPVLLSVSFLTAMASFAYEIGWIRMLSLVLGSATHAFELMLSAFIFGLAVGAWWIRPRADRVADPRVLLGGIQVAMGLAALATIPIYLASFEAMAFLVRLYQSTPAAYLLHNLGRYGLALMVMLPATALAGMALPVITGMLLRAGAGEPVIGRVYAVNTIGSVAGAGLAGLILMPVLGLKGLLVAGATLDIGLGIWLLALARNGSRRGSRRLASAVLVGLAATLTVSFGVHFDRSALTSGVYRYGFVTDAGSSEPLFYADGRTATVSAHRDTETGSLVISTNGKPDASMGRRWYVSGRDTLPVTAVEPGRDYMTQVLAPLVGLAHMPDARSAANVGHGSGMTGTTLLTSTSLERVVTIEIEPVMVQGSFVFLPANQPVFEDPRSTFAFDDAKSFFAYNQEKFDLIFLEPSNPWVSGVSSLFTREFYRTSRDFLSPNGVLVQWMQMYEMNDDLFLSVLAAIDAEFDAYRAYRVGDMDVAIIAGNSAVLPQPDWTVLNNSGVDRVMLGAPKLEAELMTALSMFDQTTFRAVLDGGVQPNSDYHPLLDVGAEKARLEGTHADGLYSFSSNRLDLSRLLAEEVQEPITFHVPSSRGVRPFVDWGRAAWMRDGLSGGGAVPPIQFLAWSGAMINVRNFLLEVRELPPRRGWATFVSAFERVERELNWGTTGWANEALYRLVFDFLDQYDAPDQYRAVVDFHYGLATFDWEAAAAAADILVTRVSGGERLVQPTVLLDGAVVAYLKSGRPLAAETAMQLLSPLSRREIGNLRSRLLEALIAEALAAQN
jgi:spermidine synthase